MAFAAAVGPHRTNRGADVRTVQQSLKRSGAAGVLERYGLRGSLTAAITRCQTSVLRFRRPDSSVDPTGERRDTLARRHRRMDLKCRENDHEGRMRSSDQRYVNG